MPRYEKLRWPVYITSLIFHLLILSLLRIEPQNISLKHEILHGLKVVLSARDIPPEMVEAMKKRQVVNNELTGEEILPQKDRYLGQKNQKYKIETVPQKIGQFKKSSKGDIKPSTVLKMSDLVISKPKDIETFAIQDTRKHKTIYIGISDSSEGRNNDYIEGVKVGEATNLNTQEYKFWGFYNRMRSRLEPVWEKLLNERVKRYFQRGNRIAIDGETMTLIKITLDEDGNVFRMKVLHSSGVSEIDNIAIDAITLSGPFFTVPRDLLKDKLAEIEWGFVVRP